jgi:hypothetical protein
MFSRPDRDEFSKRKRWEISCQTQKEKQDRTARKETEFGLHVKRLFYSTKAFGFNDLASKEQLELETPETVTFVKQFTKMHHFYDSMCADCGDFNYAKVSKPPM